MVTIRIALVSLTVFPAYASAEEPIQRGEELVARLCQSCHAIHIEGESPLAAAPPFRNLGERFKISDLEEALAEGIVTGHPDMPEFSFSAEDVSAIISYLESIQTP